MDHFLPPTQIIGDRDCPALSRVLFAALASATHTPEVQQSLVNEVKSALHRALVLIESNEKHARIQALTSLISTMIESCPAPTTSSSQQNLQNSIRSQTSLMNGIVKNLLRRGLVTDLARVTHSLDLSSPNMAQTVNATLKPLETLSRIVNIPPQMAVKSGKPLFKPETTSATQEAMEEDVTTTSTNAQTVNSINQSNQTERMNESPIVSNDGTFVGLQRETSVSDNNAFVATDVNVDDNTDNEAYGLEGVAFDRYNDVHHPRSGTFASDEIRTDDDDDDHPNEIEHEDHNEEVEHHDNVVNSNGAESESGDESQSDDEDDDDEDGSGQDEERDDDDDDDDDDDEHIDDDDEDDVEEDDEASGYVDHDEMGDALFRYQDRDDGLVFDLEEMFPTSVLHVGDRLSTLLPILGDEHTNGTDTAQPTVPPAPGNVSISHPLLVRHGDAASASVLSHSVTTNATAAGILASRSHRSGRQRIYRPSLGASAANHHSWHIPSGTRHPNPPAILQRLLGPNTAQDILQLTSSGLGSSSGPAQVILTSNDFHILATDEDLYELQNPSNFISGNTTSTLGSVPSAMLRWTEESRVLDGDSLHDCVSLIKRDIIDCLEKHRDEEVAERREKKKKEEEAKKANEPEESKSTNESKLENEQLDINTEKLAASIVEQVLGPAIQSSSVRNESETRTTPPVSMEITETTNNGDINSIQNDNEVSEMICTEAQLMPEMHVIPERIDMEVYNENQEENSNQMPGPPPLTPLFSSEVQPVLVDDGPERPPPPIRCESDEIGNAITPEDLSTITNTSSEGLNIANNDETQNESINNSTIGSATPEASSVVEVQTNEETVNSNHIPSNVNTSAEFSNILGGKSSNCFYLNNG